MSLHIKLTKIINFLKSSCKDKYSIIKYKKSLLVLQILEKLLDQQIINGFCENEGDYVILLKYNNSGESIIKDIRALYKNPFILRFKVDQLKSQFFKQQYIIPHGEHSCLYIFSTDKGLLTTEECIQHNIGGLLLFVVILK